jgi:hypothetical protein
MKEPSTVLHDHYTFSIQNKEIEDPHYIQGDYITLKMEKGDESNNSICHLHLRKVLILAKWIYKTKLGTFGEIEKLKASVILKGNKQIEGLDYFDIFAPTHKRGKVNN